MFVDTSAIVAILLGENDARALSAAVEFRRVGASHRRPFGLRPAWCLRAGAMSRPFEAQRYFDGLASQFALTEIPIDETIGRMAVACFERYGKGRHPAQLNFGDCLSYACAKAAGARLLFKGEDFAKTDVNES